jgi:hypothetical protein
MSETRTGLLTIFSPDRHEVYGEFVDGIWEIDQDGGTTNHSFTGTASDGTIDTFRRLNAAGISHVAIAFETSGERYAGDAQLLRPVEERTPGDSTVVVETTVPPSRE